MRSVTRAALGRSLSVLALAAAGLVACQATPQAAPDPIVTSLIVRNPSPFDVNIFALPSVAEKPAWLGTIGPGRSGSLPIPASALGGTQTLVVQTRAVGATAAWTSDPVAVTGGRVPILDIVTNTAGNGAGSTLYSITSLDLEAFMR